MKLKPEQKSLVERLINTAESGRPDGDYSALVIFADGPRDIRQITYGKSQTTEYGNLNELVEMYANAGGKCSAELAPYVGKIGKTALTNDAAFKQLLVDAAKEDPVMHQVQDQFFDKRYFEPAMKWATDNGFTLPLSALIIYDSFIHSGRVLPFLRDRFPEKVPAKGGEEKAWTIAYLNTRHDWLANHSKLILRNTTYRTRAYQEQVAKGNWNLSDVPVKMNGKDVFPAA